MTHTTHASTALLTSGAIATTTIAATNMTTPFALTGFICFTMTSLAGALFPDADDIYSFMSSHLLEHGVSSWTEHRKEVHTFTSGIAASSIFFLSAFITIMFGLWVYHIPQILFICGIGYFFGYSTHLLEDKYTQMGIMTKYPKSEEYVSKGNILCGSREEISFRRKICIPAALIEIISCIVIYKEIAINYADEIQQLIQLYL